MSTTFDRLSIRTRVVLIVLAILLPVAGIPAWLLAGDVREARDAAYAEVRLLATTVAADLEYQLHQWQGVLARLAERPSIRALDPGRCDPIVTEYTLIHPEFTSLVSRDLAGDPACSSAAASAQPLSHRERPWFDEAVRRGAPEVGGAFLGPRSGRWVTVVSHPLRDAAGAQIGVLALSVDLLSLSQQLLGSTPANASVSVFDRDGTLLLRSPPAEDRIGRQPGAGEPDPLQDVGEGFLSSTGRDGVPRLAAVVTIPGVDWRVAAALPEARAFAAYRSALRRALAIASALLLGALALAWRLNTIIAKPLAALARAASRVDGDAPGARIGVEGPVEVTSVARQFNRMLDARDAAASALRESEQRYRTLVDWSPEAISVHRDGTVVFVNRACVELLGATSAQELVGQPSIAAVHPDFRAAASAQVGEVIGQAPGGPLREMTFVRVDGVAVDVEVRGLPIEYGGTPAILASMRDITARKRAESALRMSEARLRGIFDSATDAIITTDEEQLIVQANPAAAQLFHCTIEELIGAPLERFIPARFRDRHRREVREFGAGAVSMRHMGRHRDVAALRADGTEFPIEASISHLNVAGQRLYTVIHRDVSERRASEAALLDGEARLRRLLEVLPDAVFVNTGNRVSYVNEAAQRLFGADESALLGRAPLELFHPDSVEPAKARIATLQSGSTTVPLTQMKIVRADGSSRIVEATATLVRDREEVSILSVLRDITDYKRTRDALTQSHGELQRLVAAQDTIQEEERKRIARELHDDLQQTLAAIKIDLVALEQQLLPSAAADVQALLAEIDELAAAAVESTRRIVNDLRPQMLEDLGLVAALEAMVGRFSRRTGIACSLDAPSLIDEDAWESPALATCLFRVAQEALGNVAKHTRASEVRIRLEVQGGRVTLRVSDNGQGLRSGDRQKTQAFGLLGMQERVRAFGGTLRVDSLPGGGTAVEAIVPAANAIATEPAVAVPAELDSAAGAEPGDALLQGMLDALAGPAAVLDGAGVIQIVNRAWRESARRDGDTGLRAGGPGVNYLEVCRRSATTDPDARRALEGLGAVLDGRRAAFSGDYACQVAGEQRWFRLHAAPMTGHRVLLTHDDRAGPPAEDPGRGPAQNRQAAPNE